MATRTPRRTSHRPASDASSAAGAEANGAASSRRPKGGASAPPKRSGQPKRTLTADNFVPTVANVLASSAALLGALVKPTISASLREKLFLAVSSVNDCRYCKWGHSHWAMAQGVPLEEVNQILRHQVESLEAKNPAEAAAILFAQHYAEQLDEFDPEALENLRQHYGDSEVAEILAYVRFITLANLTGNTVDSLLDRMPSDGKASSFFEGMVAAAAVPVGLVLTQLAKCDLDQLRGGPRPSAAAEPEPSRDSP